MTVHESQFLLMQTFIRIAEAGNLSSAAVQLGLSQPTVSRRLGALEGTLGVRLIHRTTHAMQLTEAGNKCLARAKELLNEWERLGVELRDGADTPEGVLRVVAPHAFGQQQLLAPVVKCLARYPKLTIEWLLDDGPVRFVEDAVDCVIRAGRVEEDAVVARRLFDVPRIVVAAPSVAATASAITRPSQLAKLPWVALVTYYRNSIKLENERGDKATVSFRPRFVTDNLFALRTALLAGLGVGVLSDWVVQADVASGALVHLLDRWHSRPLSVHLAYPRAPFYSAKLRAFLGVLHEAFPRPKARLTD
jgi:DNA-binding transcriptional LysR family regulator